MGNIWQREESAEISIKKSTTQREIIEICGFVIVGIIAIALWPVIFGFPLGAFLDQSYLQKAITYILFGLTMLGVVAFAILKLVTKGKVQCIIHDPEQGFFGKYSIVRNPIKLFLLSVVVFSLLGLFAVASNTFFTGVPQIIVPQDVSGVTLGFFAAEPPAFGETAVMLLIIAIELTALSFLLHFLNKGKKPNKHLFLVLAIVLLVLTIPFIWEAFHGLAYPGQENLLFATFIFGLIGVILTVSTFSFISWWVWHFMNNLFFELNKAYGMNTAFGTGDLTIMGITLLIDAIIITILVVWSAVEKKNKRGK